MALGRPPKPEREHGKRVQVFLTPEAHAALFDLAPAYQRSALVQRLILEEWARWKLRTKKK